MSDLYSPREPASQNVGSSFFAEHEEGAPTLSTSLSSDLLLDESGLTAVPFLSHPGSSSASVVGLSTTSVPADVPLLAGDLSEAVQVKREQVDLSAAPTSTSLFHDHSSAASPFSQMAPAQFSHAYHPMQAGLNTMNLTPVPLSATSSASRQPPPTLYPVSAPLAAPASYAAAAAAGSMAPMTTSFVPAAPAPPASSSSTGTRSSSRHKAPLPSLETVLAQAHAAHAALAQPTPPPISFDTGLDGDLGLSDDDDKPKTKENTRKRKARAAQTAAPASKKGGEDDVVEAKRMQRLMRNRASAQLSRERKKAHMKKLEVQLREMAAINQKLTQQISTLTMENNTLKQHVQNLVEQAQSSSDDDSQRSPRSPMSPPHFSPVHGGIEAGMGAPYGQDYAAGAYEETQGPAKRLKTHHVAGAGAGDASVFQLSQQFPGQGGPMQFARTGVLLFALVLSVGIFYSLSGLELTMPQQHSAGVSPAFRSRVLASVESLPAVAASVVAAPSVVAGTSKATVAALPSPMAIAAQDAAAADSGATASTKVSFAALEKKLLPFIKPRSSGAGASSSATSPAIESSSKALTTTMSMDLSGDDTSVSADESKAVDLYQGRRDGGAAGSPDYYELYKQVLLKSNVTLRPDTTYMFCPTAFQIKPSALKSNVTLEREAKFAGAGSSDKHQDAAHAAGLPKPNSTESDRMSPSKNRISIWVPTSAVTVGGSWDSSLFQSSWTEIDCTIQAIRPVLSMGS